MNLVHRHPPAVCIIDENLPVPRDTRVGRKTRSLSKSGYFVSVICPKAAGANRAHKPLAGVEIYRHSVFETTGHLGNLADRLGNGRRIADSQNLAPTPIHLYTLYSRNKDVVPYQHY